MQRALAILKEWASPTKPSSKYTPLLITLSFDQKANFDVHTSIFHSCCLTKRCQKASPKNARHRAPLAVSAPERRVERAALAVDVRRRGGVANGGPAGSESAKLRGARCWRVRLGHAGYLVIK